MAIKMTIKGLMSDPITKNPIIVLKDPDGEAVLPIWVGLFEATAIAAEMEKSPSPRPMTHDLLKNVIDHLKARVTRIVVTDLKENTFYALIHFIQDGKENTLDARPSDAIALALRAEAPIFVEEEVISRARNSDTNRDAGDAERLRQWLEKLDPDDMGKYEM